MNAGLVCAVMATAWCAFGVWQRGDTVRLVGATVCVTVWAAAGLVIGALS